MAILATIGAKALYLLFLWLISAAIAAWMADRKGYTERVGLTFGLVLSVVGLLIVIILPGRPGSAWKEEGAFGRRGQRRRGPDPALAVGPPPVADVPGGEGHASPAPPPSGDPGDEGARS